MDKWLDFYKTFFASRVDAEEWIARCEALSPPENQPKIMMHQAQRLISIADDISKIRSDRDSLQLLFYIICAENQAKLYEGFEGEGFSRKYVRHFFEKFVTGDDRRTMELAFTNYNDPNMRPISFEQAVDLLYNIRCDVVHEGNYWSFSFHNGSNPMINVEPDVLANITIDQLRAIVVRGCINAITIRL